jgi:hypothetical protein
MKVYEVIENCRVCKSTKLTEAIQIEDQYLSPTFVKENTGPLSKIKVPHTLLLCDDCGLLQLKETVNPDLLYKDYFYRSAISDTMRADLKNVIDDVTNRISLNDGDCVLDIGANDCTMISFYPKNLKRFGIEPAENINWDSVDENIKIVNDYFCDSAIERCGLPDKVKIFTSCAMFYDIDDPNSFVSTVKNNLHDEGLFCIQLSYLPAMLINLNFYDICNEHLEYYSLSTLNTLMNRHGLEIYDATENHVNGGSVRVMITHKEKNMTKTEDFLGLLAKEDKMNLTDVQTYKDFYKEIMDMKEKVVNVILEELKESPVLGLGASTKGNMLLQIFGLTKQEIPFISERNPDKVGLKTLGTDIELISEEEARSKEPGIMLVLPWYFKDEIVKREAEYIAGGGKLLMPMPYPHIIDKNGETVL